MRKCSRYALAAQILAVALLLVPLPAPPVWAKETDYSKVQIKTTKVSGNIYMLEGAGSADEWFAYLRDSSDLGPPANLFRREIGVDSQKRF